MHHNLTGMDKIVRQRQAVPRRDRFDFMENVGIPRKYGCVELRCASVVERLFFSPMNDTNFPSSVHGGEDDDDGRKHSRCFFSTATSS